MKIIPFVASILLSLAAIGQKSYYFSEPVPTDQANISSVDKKFFGNYKQENASRKIIVNEEGIFVESTNVSSIGRDLIRESTKYDVRDGYIFGVVKDDSLPCVLEGDRYYFGVRNMETLIGPDTKNTLRKSDKEPNTYYVSTWENGYYLPIKLTFSKGTLILAYFDYELETDEFDFVLKQKSIQTEFHELIILSPTTEEMAKLMSDGVFSDIKEHKKVK